MRFLQKLADRSDVNRMSASNLAIVIGPNLLWPEDEEAYVILRAWLSRRRVLVLLCR